MPQPSAFPCVSTRRRFAYFLAATPQTSGRLPTSASTRDIDTSNHSTRSPRDGGSRGEFFEILAWAFQCGWPRLRGHDDTATLSSRCPNHPDGAVCLQRCLSLGARCPLV